MLIYKSLTTCEYVNKEGVKLVPVCAIGDLSFRVKLENNAVKRLVPAKMPFSTIKNAMCKTDNVVCATSKALEQPAYAQSYQSLC